MKRTWLKQHSPGQSDWTRGDRCTSKSRATESEQWGLRCRQGLLEQVVAQRPDHYPAMLELASLAGRKGDVKLQASWLEKAVAAQPALMGPRRALALLYLNTQRPLKALETAQPALKADPNSVEFLGIVGAIRVSAGKTEKSIKTFQRLVNVTPQAVEAHFLLARAYGLAGKNREMQAALTKALEIDPSHLPSQVALVRFFVLDGQVWGS